jgi:hypothetical protein
MEYQCTPKRTPSQSFKRCGFILNKNMATLLKSTLFPFFPFLLKRHSYWAVMHYCFTFSALTYLCVVETKNKT